MYENGQNFISTSFQLCTHLKAGVNFIKALTPKFAPQNAKKDGIFTFQFHNTYWAVKTPKNGNKVAQNVLPKKQAFSRQNKSCQTAQGF